VKPSMPYCDRCSEYGHYPSQHQHADLEAPLHTYRVSWTGSVEASSPEEASRLVREMWDRNDREALKVVSATDIGEGLEFYADPESLLGHLHRSRSTGGALCRRRGVRPAGRGT
jgi:hypothetical protein